MDRPRDGGSGLSGEKVDDRFLHLRQSDSGSLGADVGRDAPGGFLADGPECIGDGVEEKQFSLGAFGEHKLVQMTASGEVGAFESAAVPNAGVTEVERGGKLGSGLPRASSPWRRSRSRECRVSFSQAGRSACRG